MLFNERIFPLETNRIMIVAVLMAASVWTTHMLWAEQAVSPPAMEIERSNPI